MEDKGQPEVGGGNLERARFRLGRLAAQRRWELGLSVPDMAFESGVSPVDVMRMEQGEDVPDGVLQKVFAKLGLPLGEPFAAEGAGEPAPPEGAPPNAARGPARTDGPA